MRSHAEEVPARFGLAEHVVDGILALGFRLEDQRLAKADVLKLSRLNVVSTYVGDPVVGPEEFGDLHASFYSVAPYVRRTL
jgi:hypothetical protein